MTVTVEPGIVLDALNAWLRPHGLWFPVDVSTSAQATLGGMAGNNSCGSRSIAYGNMVHNVRRRRGAARPTARKGGWDRKARCEGAAPRVRELMTRPARHRRARARRDCAPGAEGNATRRRLQPRRLPSAERTTVHAGRQCQLRPPAGGFRGHAGLDAHAHAEARPAAEAPDARRGQLPNAVQGDGADASTSSRSAPRRSSWSIAR